MSDVYEFDLVWRCAGCGGPCPDRARTCACPTASLYLFGPRGLERETKLGTVERRREMAAAAGRLIAIARAASSGLALSRFSTEREQAGLLRARADDLERLLDSDPLPPTIPT